MDKNEEFGFSLEHLLFEERKCRVCGETKDCLLYTSDAADE